MDLMDLDNFNHIFTKVYHGSEHANNAILQFIDRAKRKIECCISSIAPSVMIEINAIKERRIDAVKNRGLKLRYVTEITKDNINYVKEMLAFSDIRHLDRMKGNFEVADEKEYVAFATLYKAQDIPQLIFSNVSEIVEQQQFIFDTFWEKAIPAEQKIKEIENGIIPQTTVVFSDYKNALQKEMDMIKSATKEIQIIYSTSNAFHLQEHSGTLQLLKEMAFQNPDLKIKILTPIDSSIKQSPALMQLKNYKGDILIQDVAPSFDIKIKTLVVDRRESLVMELKHVREEKATASIGFSIYSNSEPTVLSYASIFEVLYNQSMIFQQLKQEDSIKSEFINIAAHELRTPIMPILNGLEIMEEKLGDKIQNLKRELDIITRNALRLQNLSESILQVIRIESGSFNINIQKGIDIISLILQVIEDIERKYAYTDKINKVSILFLPSINIERYEDNEDVKTNDDYVKSIIQEQKQNIERESEMQLKTNTQIPYNNHYPQQPLYINCDSQKISQVIFNLLDNAMKFTAEGKIIVSLNLDSSTSYSHSKIFHNDENKLNNDINNNNFEIQDDNNKSNNKKKHDESENNMLIFSIQDTGIGINHRIKDQLFEKFATKSNQGTGLGLYLSKKIVEAHGGKIWVEELTGNDINNNIVNIGNKQPHLGTKFMFSLPTQISTINVTRGLEKETIDKGEIIRE
jgi:two-component system, OmpR family, sensor histidine kinase VicK